MCFHFMASSDVMLHKVNVHAVEILIFAYKTSVLSNCACAFIENVISVVSVWL